MLAAINLDLKYIELKPVDGYLLPCPQGAEPGKGPLLLQLLQEHMSGEVVSWHGPLVTIVHMLAKPCT